MRAVEAAVRSHAEAAEGRFLRCGWPYRADATAHAPDERSWRRLRDEVEAAAQRSSDDVWLERLRIATTEARKRRASRRWPSSTLGAG